ncbi:helix-turn-helix transcriptional regulator [Sphingobium subterraneum]|uniref:Prophage regulatory protein n=1 Tax=Sphingobium subterraneum TaxID=627688 RepID=A0A841JAK5_9SPHN|nr:AlpA family phage regulatory protein [Sphingobium subterraneum]MBB6125171.1 prophage regulatory protein [Sphingobium subterraneum]
MTTNPKRPPHYAGRLFFTTDDLTRLGLPYANTTRLRWEAEGKFPKRVRLGGRSVAYLADEIDAYIAQLAASRGEDA